MNILHITSHFGGGLGTVIRSWVEKDTFHNHTVFSLDILDFKTIAWIWAGSRSPYIVYSKTMENYPQVICELITESDIVVVHWYDHPMLIELFSRSLPACRLIFWCHKNYLVPQRELDYPDLFIDTSPIQGHGQYIWSTGNMDRFLAIQPEPHEGFNVGYIGTVDYKKMHKNFLLMCAKIAQLIPNVHFTVIGDNNIGGVNSDLFTFTGKVDDVASYLAEMDVFGYPLRLDHLGTCEQVLGEAMTAGIVPVTMNNPAERKIVQHHFNGFIAKTKKEYTDWIKFLYRNPTWRKWMSDNAQTTAKELYSIDTMIAKWKEVFEEIMEKPKRSRGIL